jgi:hypothetical protein
MHFLPAVFLFSLNKNVVLPSFAAHNQIILILLEIEEFLGKYRVAVKEDMIAFRSHFALRCNNNSHKESAGIECNPEY